MYDLEQAFDALWLEDCMLDLYDSLPEDECYDKLALIYETNVNNLVAVNIGVGQTERVSIHRIVQQGSDGIRWNVQIVWIHLVKDVRAGVFTLTCTRVW